MNCRFINASFMQKISATVVIVAAYAFASVSAEATTINLVKNGDFELTSGYGQIGFNVTVPDWTSTGYNFIFAQGTGDTTGAMSQFGAALTLWGANNGGASPLATSMNGGNFIANDGAYNVQPLQQTINGLTIGTTYNVSFEWAAAQQFGFSGNTTEQWIVNLGSNAATQQATAVYHNTNHSSSPWMQETMSFTATSASEVLSFLAVGTPAGEPPFSLLDGVSMVEAVPEPATWLMLFTGLGLIGFIARRRKDNSV